MNVVNKKLLKNIYDEIKINPKVSQKGLAKKYNVCERTIRRYCKILKDKGYIARTNTGRKTEWHIINTFKQ